ncbi:acyl-CoA dehydrogenase family protein [uncultured Jatrophihabitans sp.]|uniref:acyl-CoA dehydrogenase family protein n=1 Tax=uncultured Jatrophihabitans sp. TaxID=1610747 RepID=UPI0035C978D3
MRRSIFETEHEQLRDTAHDFFLKYAVPHRAEWEAQGHVGREIWRQAAEHGLLGLEIPEEYGGAGIHDYRFNAVVIEEAARTRSGVALTLQNEIVAPYLIGLGTEEQKQRWLPGMATGELLGAIAMSEPGAGSDLAGIRTSARRDGDGWVVNGSKTFISGGLLADVVIVVARTDPEAGHKGFSLLLVEDGMAGFERGKKLDKVGQRTSDTMELFFSDVRVPAGNLLGEQGRGFYSLMRNLPQERLGIAVAGLASAEHAYAVTAEYARTREAFGQPIASFQVNRHALSEMHTKLQVARTYLDQCILGVSSGELTAEDAAGAKWWITELEWEVVDRCMQMFGGYGYINEYEISQIWRDARIQRLYGGTTEIMKDLVGRKLGF